MIAGGGNTSIPTLDLLTLEAGATLPYDITQKGHLKLIPVRVEYCHYAENKDPTSAAVVHGDGKSNVGMVGMVCLKQEWG